MLNRFDGFGDGSSPNSKANLDKHFIGRMDKKYINVYIKMFNHIQLACAPIHSVRMKSITKNLIIQSIKHFYYNRITKECVKFTKSF